MIIKNLIRYLKFRTIYIYVFIWHYAIDTTNFKLATSLPTGPLLTKIEGMSAVVGLGEFSVQGRCVSPSRPIEDASRT